MAQFVPWNSQPLDKWAATYAEGQFIDLNGRRTHYLKKGLGEPVILVHGFFFDSFTWHNNVSALAQRFQVYVPDLWGFGYSTREPLEYGYSLYAEQLLSFMDALSIRKASFVGHSMGGGTCIFFALRHPDRVDKLLLVDAAGIPDRLPLLGKITNLPHVGEVMYGMNNNFVRKFALISNWIYDKSYVTDSYFDKATRFHKIAGSSEVMLTILRKQFFHTLSDEIRRLGTTDMPILIVWGRHDAAIPLESGREMHALLKGSSMEILEDVAHSSHDEKSEQFNRLALEFLT